jgi:hypothetical protein
MLADLIIAQYHDADDNLQEVISDEASGSDCEDTSGYFSDGKFRQKKSMSNAMFARKQKQD